MRIGPSLSFAEPVARSEIDAPPAASAANRAPEESTAANTSHFRDLLSRPNSVDEQRESPDDAQSSATKVDPAPLSSDEVGEAIATKDDQLAPARPLLSTPIASSLAPPLDEKELLAAPQENDEPAIAGEQVGITTAPSLSPEALSNGQLVDAGEDRAVVDKIDAESSVASDNSETLIVTSDITEGKEATAQTSPKNANVRNDRLALQAASRSDDRAELAVEAPHGETTKLAEGVEVGVAAEELNAEPKAPARTSEIERPLQAALSTDLETATQEDVIQEKPTEQKAANDQAAPTLETSSDRLAVSRKSKSRGEGPRTVSAHSEPSSEVKTANEAVTIADQIIEPLQPVAASEPSTPSQAVEANAQRLALDPNGGQETPVLGLSLGNDDARASHAESRNSASNVLDGPAAKHALNAAETTRFVHRVARAFQAAQQGDGELRLRLSPPELGSMRLELKLQDGAMTARLEVDSSATRAVLLDNLPALRERLAEQNVRVDRFEVHVGSGEQQSSSGRQFEDAPHQRGFAVPHAPAKRESETQRATPAVRLWSSKDRLDVLV